MRSPSVLGATAVALTMLVGGVLGGPSMTVVNETVTRLSNGDSFSATFESTGHAYEMVWNGRDIVNGYRGGYSDFGGRTTFNFTNGATVLEQTDSMLHVVFPSYYADVHYVLFSGLPGYYQYVINNNLGIQGEVRSLYRLDPAQFVRGRTNCRDALLPSMDDILTGYKVQDETWQLRNGSYITKYDFSCFVRSLDFHGVYGDDVGAWVIAPGKDYFVGDQLKQELMVHRESGKGDAVLLHMFHGTHFNNGFLANDVPPGKMWGPWLFYVNNGDLDDAKDRAAKENAAWPYRWVQDADFHKRGTVGGKIVLSDGRPAAGASVFLGDEDGAPTMNQGTTFQYTTYADDDGSFTFKNVRREKGYRLQAWSTGGKLADVDSVFNETMVSLAQRGTNTSSCKVDLGTLTWPVPARDVAWRIGDFDRRTLGFRHGGAPMQHGLSDNCAANLVYAIGVNSEADWCYAQSAQGNWTVIFDPAPAPARDAVLSLSWAGYTSQIGEALGKDSATTAEIPPTGLNVSMNQVFVDMVVSLNASDGAVRRSATTAGDWFYRQLRIPGDLFLADRANRLDLTLTANNRWSGIMWDAIKLEWL